MGLPPPTRVVARREHGPGSDCLWLVLAAAVFVVQEIGISFIGRDGSGAWLRAGIFLVTTAVLIGMALHFRRFVGAWVIAIGIGMNLVPMALHGGVMPVSYEVIEASGAFPEITREDIGTQAGNSKDVILERRDVRAYWLSDRYFLEIPGYGPNIYSAGDFVAFGGLVVAVVEAAAMAAGVGLRRRTAPQAS